MRMLRNLPCQRAAIGLGHPVLRLDELISRNARLERFAFRALKPVFDIAPFKVCGEPNGASAELWVADDAGDLCMSARATFSPLVT